jgi:hypothetical protein
MPHGLEDSSLRLRHGLPKLRIDVDVVCLSGYFIERLTEPTFDFVLVHRSKPPSP